MEITLPLNELFVFEREYKRCKSVEISPRPIINRPDAKGVGFLAKFILLKYNIFSFLMFKILHKRESDHIRYEFSYKFKYKVNSIEIFTNGRAISYKLSSMEEIYKQKANKFYPFHKGLIYEEYKYLNNQLYNELYSLKDELSYYTECSEVLVRITVIRG